MLSAGNRTRDLAKSGENSLTTEEMGTKVVEAVHELSAMPERVIAG